MGFIYSSFLGLYTIACASHSLSNNTRAWPMTQGLIVQLLPVAAIVSSGGWSCGHPPRSPEIWNYSDVQHWLALSPSAPITGHQQCCHGLLPFVFIWQWSSESMPLFQSQRNFFPPTLWRWAAPETGQPCACYTVCSCMNVSSVFASIPFLLGLS